MFGQDTSHVPNEVLLFVILSGLIIHLTFTFPFIIFSAYVCMAGVWIDTSHILDEVMLMFILSGLIIHLTFTFPF